MARASSAPSLKLLASAKLPTLEEDIYDDSAVRSKATASTKKPAGASSSTAVIGIAAGVFAGIALAAFVLAKGRK